MSIKYCFVYRLMVEKIKQEFQQNHDSSFAVSSLRSQHKLDECLPKKEKSYNRWRQSENYAYITYLEVCRQVLEDSALRKALRIFRHMSKLISTRTHQQIKSHHQKMMRKYRSTEQILKHSKRQIKDYAELSAGNRRQIANVATQISSFFQQQNNLQKFCDLKIVAEWQGDYKREEKVKVQEQSHEILIEQEGLDYILYGGNSKIKKQEQKEETQYIRERVKEEHNES